MGGSGRPERWRGIAYGLFIVFFAVAVIGVGVFIEFHEGFFGHGEGTAPGVLNAKDYIRAHFVYGFIMIPMLFVSILDPKSRLA